MRGQVSGLRQDPAEVWLVEGRPARFAWRGRQFTVLAIIERPASESADGADAGARQCWRVMAAPARDVRPAAYLLCVDPATGRWQVSPAGD
jgi:hypothetical protein